MTEIFVILHNNSDELVAIFWKEEDYNEYMEEHSILGVVSIIVQVMITVIIVDMGVKWIVKVMKGSGEYMTEKRFMLDDAGELIDLNTPKFVDYGEECCNLLNELAEENTQLKNKLKFLNELNKPYGTIIEENERLKSKGLKVLEFYEYKLKNADRKDFENVREELWIVKEVLCEMGVIKDE